LVEVRRKLKEYEGIIADLQNKNRELAEMNALLQQQNNALTEESAALRKERDEMLKKLELVSGIQVHDFQITALRAKSSGKYTAVTKASKVNSIKTCFTVTENLIADAGERVLFLRIISPDGRVMPAGEGVAEAKFKSENGGDIDYTEKRTIDYNKKALEACIFWNNTEKLIKGNYIFEIWLEGKMIGKGNLILK